MPSCTYYFLHFARTKHAKLTKAGFKMNDLASSNSRERASASPNPTVVSLAGICMCSFCLLVVAGILGSIESDDDIKGLLMFAISLFRLLSSL